MTINYDEKKCFWICSQCGEKYGKSIDCISTWNLDVCDYCGNETIVTHIRDYGYPELPKEELKMLT
jgi:NAD-dependent SIR2 family protein deacetylase